ncbi:hypothetical protein CLV72_105414 [Allonocardiopsis opalescens]|uniref:Uncharacterized protein n=1 Tax=Allonocardiopsis opalescens TaxID=1144618 RepID=A0A2T0Q2P0_9ACTN|nr:hypothetical protein CLV72_105414 [Allonocardiopsis opalescens]
MPTAVLLAVALAYTVLYGIPEVLALSLRPPGRSWQVPKQWVAGRGYAGRAAVWGATLGPGIMTRNPVAGTWLFPMLAALSGDPATAALVGAAAGALHGLGRAGGVLRQSGRLATEPGDPFETVIRLMHWRTIDGLLLAAAAGLLAGALF